MPENEDSKKECSVQEPTSSMNNATGEFQIFCPVCRGMLMIFKEAAVCTGCRIRVLDLQGKR